MTCFKTEVYVSMFKKALKHRVGRVWRERMRMRFLSDILRRMVF